MCFDLLEGKKLLNTECVFWFARRKKKVIERAVCVFFSTYFVWHISYSPKNSALYESLDSFRLQFHWWCFPFTPRWTCSDPLTLSTHVPHSCAVITLLRILWCSDSVVAFVSYFETYPKMTCRCLVSSPPPMRYVAESVIRIGKLRSSSPPVTSNTLLSN